MSNMMPGDNSGAEPKEHRADCPTLCTDREWCEHYEHDECWCEERDIADMEAAVEAQAEAYYESRWGEL